MGLDCIKLGDYCTSDNPGAPVIELISVVNSKLMRETSWHLEGVFLFLKIGGTTKERPFVLLPNNFGIGIRGFLVI